MTLRLLAVASALPVLFCGSLGEDEAGLLYPGSVVTRSHARALLNRGVWLNVGRCPENRAAGLYAVDSVIPGSLHRTHYEANTVDNCVVMLALAPCLSGIPLDEEGVTAADLGEAATSGYYAQILGLCGLKPAGPEALLWE